MENAINDAMITAIQLLDKQAVISNNLANISTTGFKEQLNYIINKNHNNTNMLDKEKVKEYYNFSQGILNYTERNLDCVVQNNGWLVVKDSHGQEAYTKNGHIKINKYGKLTIQNHPIVGNNCDISIPNGSNIKISSTGKIILINKTTKDVKDIIIGALKLVRCSDNNLLKRKNGLFYFNKKIKSYKHKNLNHDNNTKTKHTQHKIGRAHV